MFIIWKWVFYVPARNITNFLYYGESKAERFGGIAVFFESFKQGFGRNACRPSCIGNRNIQLIGLYLNTAIFIIVFDCIADQVGNHHIEQKWVSSYFNIQAKIFTDGQVFAGHKFLKNFELVVDYIIDCNLFFLAVLLVFNFGEYQQGLV